MSPNAVVAGVFGKTPGEITDESSPETVPEWDSLGHVTLLIELESVYGVSFSPEESFELRSVESIKDALAKHGATW